MNQDADFFAPEATLVEQICSEESFELLDELFQLRTSRWRHPHINAECYTDSTFGDLERRLKPHIAFKLIPKAVDLVLKQQDLELRATAFSLLCGISRSSDTTELPLALETHWERLADSSRGLSRKDLLYWKLLCEWYRRRTT